MAAVTQADLDLLTKMIANGVLEHETADGKRVEFPSFTDLKKRHAFITRHIRGSRRSKVGFASFAGDDGE